MAKQSIWVFTLIAIVSLCGVIWGVLNFNRSTARITWTTETEIGTVGYILLRSNSPESDYVRINDQIIPADNDVLGGGVYEYVDKGVLPGRIYYYRLVEVTAQGTGDEFGPIEVKTTRDGQYATILFSMMLLFSSLKLIRKRS